MGTLTVRENLLFSGNLRLPRKQNSTADKKNKVESIIQELGLEDCADSKVSHKCYWRFLGPALLMQLKKAISINIVLNKSLIHFCGAYTQKCYCPDIAG